MQRRVLAATSVFLAFALVSCATSSSNPVAPQAPEPVPEKAAGSIATKQSTPRSDQRKALQGAVIVTHACEQSAVEGSDVAAIRKRVQKDLADAGLSEQEIREQLALYDMKTCDLR